MRDPKHPQWPDGGERTHVQEVAERWKWAYVDAADRAHMERTVGRVRSLELGAAIEQYEAHRARVVEPHTFAGDRTALGHLQDIYPGSADVHQIQPQRLVDHLLDHGYRPSTVRQYVTSLKAFWRWLEVPFPRVELPRPVTSDVRFWTPDQVQRLRKAAPSIDPLLLLALDCTLYLGLRVGEVFALRWEDFDPPTVRVQRQLPQGSKEPKPLKGKRARTTFILPGWEHEGTEGWVLHRGGELIGRRVQWRWMKKLLDATGLNRMGAGWHMGRHTYARSALVDHGLSLEQLQVFLGHRSITTTQESYGWLTSDTAAIMATRAVYDR